MCVCVCVLTTCSFTEDRVSQVVTWLGQEIFFKMRETTPLDKLMRAFAARQMVSIDSLFFFYNEERAPLSNAAPHRRAPQPTQPTSDRQARLHEA